MIDHPFLIMPPNIGHNRPETKLPVLSKPLWYNPTQAND